MPQQVLFVKLVEDGLFVSDDGLTTVRELGEYDNLKVHSSRMDRSWLVPWVADAQCFQLRSTPISLEIEPDRTDNGIVTRLRVVVIG